MTVNEPTVLAGLQAAFASYEAALMANDVAALDGWFWRSDLTLRYGVGENLYGYDAIAQFRILRPGGSPQRVLANTVITTFSETFGAASTEFRRENSTLIGRQTQTWVLFAQGWRVVAAHVSMMADGH